MQALQPGFAPLEPLCTSLACDVSNTWSSTARSKFTAASFLEKVYTLQCGCVVPGGKATRGLGRSSHALHKTDGQCLHGKPKNLHQIFCASGDILTRTSLPLGPVMQSARCTPAPLVACLTAPRQWPIVRSDLIMQQACTHVRCPRQLPTPDSFAHCQHAARCTQFYLTPRSLFPLPPPALPPTTQGFNRCLPLPEVTCRRRTTSRCHPRRR